MGNLENLEHLEMLENLVIPEHRLTRLVQYMRIVNHRHADPVPKALQESKVGQDFQVTLVHSEHMERKGRMVMMVLLVSPVPKVHLASGVDRVRQGTKEKLLKAKFEKDLLVILGRSGQLDQREYLACQEGMDSPGLKEIEVGLEALEKLVNLDILGQKELWVHRDHQVPRAHAFARMWIQ